MAEKILNTRILLKYDTYEAWLSNNPILKKGEVAIATIPSNQDGVVNAPSTLIKIGDGTSDYKTLKFLSGLAADVHGWAKAENKPAYEAGEITGIDAYIANYVNDQMGISVDTDTQYQIVKVDDYNYKLQSKGKTDEAWADVENSVIEIPNDTAAIEALQGLVGEKAVATQITEAIAALKLAETYEAKGEAAKVQAVLGEYQTANDAAVKKVADDLAAEAVAARAAEKANADAIDAIEASIGTVADGKTVVKMIEDAQAAATYDDTALAGRVTANETAIGTLNANAETAGSVDYKIAQAVAAIMENPDETMNSINELVTWCNDHAEDALELSNQVTANKDDIAALDLLVGDTAVATQISDAIAAALKIEGVDKYALAADLTAAIGRVAALEAKAHEHANKDVIDGITADQVTAWDGAVQSVTTTENGGLKVSRTDNDVTVDIDDTLTWIFDCGTSENIPAPTDA